MSVGSIGQKISSKSDLPKHMSNQIRKEDVKAHTRWNE